MTEEDRYDRQRRLREVGASGQSRIERSVARLAPGPGADVAEAYLRRAGVAHVSVDEAAPAQLVHASHFRFSQPAAVAGGALAALQHLIASIESE